MCNKFYGVKSGEDKDGLTVFNCFLKELPSYERVFVLDHVLAVAPGCGSALFYRFHARILVSLSQ